MPLDGEQHRPTTLGDGGDPGERCVTRGFFGKDTGGCRWTLRKFTAGNLDCPDREVGDTFDRSRLDDRG